MAGLRILKRRPQFFEWLASDRGVSSELRIRVCTVCCMDRRDARKLLLYPHRQDKKKETITPEQHGHLVGLKNLASLQLTHKALGSLCSGAPLSLNLEENSGEQQIRILALPHTHNPRTHLKKRTIQETVFKPNKFIFPQAAFKSGFKTSIL
ncbi:hypothetical protein CROQUDRAFT_89372 [Cronartium quercuum f. sp. fusiforme G11]|uniref:Uncharacterized protein n=1 Tax=Cronartium quercuum f. sp. fusiforme G11 TaxID=708437 RepID=A0A9P6NTP0_9BASI|nr:hypothetical protein CROQUDRAFT_89372 [Cronartium quercuum f. sp. fusiforme G11]